MAPHAPGRSERTGLTIVQLLRMFPDDDTAERWFEKQRWPEGPVCPHCGCMRAVRSTHPTMPLRCKDCRKHFSVKKGTVIESSKLGFQAWAIVTYMATTNLKGVSSMKVHRELGITQKAAWHMIQRVREAFVENASLFVGTVEVEETYVGGKERNKHANKRSFGRGTVGKATIMGARERGGKIKARPLGYESGETLARFVHESVQYGETVCTDDHKTYKELQRHYTHETVKHSASEYVRGRVHTQDLSVPPTLPDSGKRVVQNGEVTNDLVFSVFQSGNEYAFPQILDLYVRPGSVVADVTYGKGVFWRRVPDGLYELWATDLLTGTDCRDLPYADGEIDAVVLDPPYMHSPGGTAHSSTDTPFEQYYRNNASANRTGKKYHEAVLDLYFEAGEEAFRVLRDRGVMIVKCQDEVCSNRQRFTHVEIMEQYAEIGFVAEDLFVVVRNNRPGVSRAVRQVHARKNHSYFLVFWKRGDSRGLWERPT